MNFYKKVKRMPIWGVALSLILGASALVALAAGSGIAGDNPAVVQEPLTLSDLAASSKLVLPDATSTDLVIFNDDTSFAGAAETFPGDSYSIKLLLKNDSNADVVQRMAIDSPEGFTFDVDGGSRISVSQEKATTFLVRVDEDSDAEGLLTASLTDTTATDELRINIFVRPQVGPGFYRIGVEMKQFGSEE